MQSKEDEMIHRSDQIDKIRQFVNRKPNEESLLHMDEQNGYLPRLTASELCARCVMLSRQRILPVIATYFHIEY